MKQQEFQQRVEEAMKKCVKKHQHHHPLYQPTKITEYQIDEERKLAAWILFEQIDTDRLTPETKETLLKLAGPGHPISKLIPEDVVEEGWLGDQFRYSVWKMEGEEEPVQVYENHAWLRPKTASPLTGTKGRDCTLKNLKLDKGKIKVKNAEGNELIF